MERISGLEIIKISKKLKLLNGYEEIIFNDFSMKIKNNEIAGIFGPNGCGKSTLLNMISGIMKPDKGSIIIKNKKPAENNIAYVFQDYRSSLFPWLNIKDNILFPLSLRKINKKVKNKMFSRLIKLINIPFNLKKYPYQLSGGQQQIVSIMRCLIAEPDIMLIDEPFSALDYSNSMWLMEKMSLIFKMIKIPVLIVAHDINHLINLTDKIYFLSNKPVRILREEYSTSCLSENRSKIDDVFEDLNSLILNENRKIIYSRQEI